LHLYILAITMVSVDAKELDALVSLIDEPNEDMYDVVRQKILGYGESAIHTLEDIWGNTFNEGMSLRIESIIDDIRQETLLTQYNNWFNNSESNIIEGLSIITSYFQPDLEKDYYNKLFDKICRDTWLELNDNLTALEKIKVLNHVFYSVYKFKTDITKNSIPEEYFLNKILELKQGNAVSLGIIYIAVAQKLGIPISGVDLPNSFILAYTIKQKSSISINDSTDVIFYLNPAKEGAVFTKNEITNYIEQINIKSEQKFYKPCHNTDILKILITSLIDTLENNNKQSKAKVLNKLLTKLKN